MNPRSLFPASLLVALALVAVPAARADLGVEEVSRSGGAPGENVTLTVGCGACSAIGAEAPPSFPISLVPVAKVPQPHRCGPNALCLPRVRAVPRQAPFTYLGEARLRGGEKKRAVLRYVLDFAIPELRRGDYTYVIYCDDCVEGRGGSLIADPDPDGDWRLRIRR